MRLSESEKTVLNTFLSNVCKDEMGQPLVYSEDEPFDANQFIDAQRKNIKLIQMACQYGSTGVVEALIKLGACVDDTDFCPLKCAVERNSIDIVSMLVDAGACVENEMRDKKYGTLLFLLLMDTLKLKTKLKDKVEIACYLLSKVNHKMSYMSQSVLTEYGGVMPLHLLLTEAMYQGRLDLIKILVAAGARVEDMREGSWLTNKKGTRSIQSPMGLIKIHPSNNLFEDLIRSSECPCAERVEIADYLLSQVKDPLAFINLGGESLIASTIITQDNKIRMLQVMMKHGFEVETIKMGTQSMATKTSILRYCVKKGWERIVEFLLKNPNIVKAEKKIRAEKPKKAYSLMNMLTSRSMNSSSTIHSEFDRISALITACDQQDITILRLLLKYCDPNEDIHYINQPCPNGLTVYDYALKGVHSKKSKVCAQILSMLEKYNILIDNQSLLLSFQVRSLSKSKEMIERSAAQGEDFNRKNDAGFNLVHALIRHTELKDDRVIALIDMLVEKGANLAIPASNGMTPLMFSVEKNNVSLARAIIQRQLAILDDSNDVKGNYKLIQKIFSPSDRCLNNALTLALKNSLIEMIEMFFEQGFRIDIYDNLDTILPASFFTEMNSSFLEADKYNVSIARKAIGIIGLERWFKNRGKSLILFLIEHKCYYILSQLLEIYEEEHNKSDEDIDHYSQALYSIVSNFEYETLLSKKAKRGLEGLKGVKVNLRAKLPITSIINSLYSLGANFNQSIDQEPIMLLILEYLQTQRKNIGIVLDDFSEVANLFISPTSQLQLDWFHRSQKGNTMLNLVCQIFSPDVVTQILARIELELQPQTGTKNSYIELLKQQPILIGDATADSIEVFTIFLNEYKKHGIPVTLHDIVRCYFHFYGSGFASDEAWKKIFETLITQTFTCRYLSKDFVERSVYRAQRDSAHEDCQVAVDNIMSIIRVAVWSQMLRFDKQELTELLSSEDLNMDYLLPLDELPETISVNSYTNLFEVSLDVGFWQLTQMAFDLIREKNVKAVNIDLSKIELLPKNVSPVFYKKLFKIGMQAVIDGNQPSLSACDTSKFPDVIYEWLSEYTKSRSQDKTLLTDIKTIYQLITRKSNWPLIKVMQAIEDKLIDEQAVQKVIRKFAKKLSRYENWVSLETGILLSYVDFSKLSLVKQIEYSHIFMRRSNQLESYFTSLTQTQSNRMISLWHLAPRDLVAGLLDGAQWLESYCYAVELHDDRELSKHSKREIIATLFKKLFILSKIAYKMDGFDITKWLRKSLTDIDILCDEENNADEDDTCLVRFHRYHENMMKDFINYYFKGYLSISPMMHDAIQSIMTKPPVYDEKWCLESARILSEIKGFAHTLSGIELSTITNPTQHDILQLVTIENRYQTIVDHAPHKSWSMVIDELYEPLLGYKRAIWLDEIVKKCVAVLLQSTEVIQSDIVTWKYDLYKGIMRQLLRSSNQTELKILSVMATQAYGIDVSCRQEYSLERIKRGLTTHIRYLSENPILDEKMRSFATQAIQFVKCDGGCRIVIDNQLLHAMQVSILDECHANPNHVVDSIVKSSITRWLTSCQKYTNRLDEWSNLVGFTANKSSGSEVLFQRPGGLLASMKYFYTRLSAANRQSFEAAWQGSVMHKVTMTNMVISGKDIGQKIDTLCDWYDQYGLSASLLMLLEDNTGIIFSIMRRSYVQNAFQLWKQSNQHYTQLERPFHSRKIKYQQLVWQKWHVFLGSFHRMAWVFDEWKSHLKLARSNQNPLLKQSIRLSSYDAIQKELDYIKDMLSIYNETERAIVLRLKDYLIDFRQLFAMSIDQLREIDQSDYLVRAINLQRDISSEETLLFPWFMGMDYQTILNDLFVGVDLVVSLDSSQVSPQIQTQNMTRRFATHSLYETQLRCYFRDYITAKRFLNNWYVIFSKNCDESGIQQAIISIKLIYNLYCYALESRVDGSNPTQANDIFHRLCMTEVAQINHDDDFIELTRTQPKLESQIASIIQLAEWISILSDNDQANENNLLATAFMLLDYHRDITKSNRSGSVHLLNYSISVISDLRAKVAHAWSYQTDMMDDQGRVSLALHGRDDLRYHLLKMSQAILCHYQNYERFFIAWSKIKEVSLAIYQNLLDRKDITSAQTGRWSIQIHPKLKAIRESIHAKASLVKEQLQIVLAGAMSRVQKTGDAVIVQSSLQSETLIGSLFQQGSSDYFPIVDHKPKGSSCWDVSTSSDDMPVSDAEMLRVLDNNQVFTYTRNLN